jgi:alpha-tubulin suppressor-like RCC1 family protein
MKTKTVRYRSLVWAIFAAALSAAAGAGACAGEFKIDCPPNTVQVGGGDVDDVCVPVAAGMGGAGGAGGGGVTGEGGGGSGGNAGGGGGPIACVGAEERVCDGACVDVRGDNKHCGDCGKACSGTCREGACTPVAQLALGVDHSCVILADTTVKCWGANDSGQVGDGTTTDRSTPVAVVTLSDAAQLALGKQHSCARLGEDGGIKCWGSNASGQLSTSDTSVAQRALPDYVYADYGIYRGEGDRVLNVVSGDAHLCASDDQGSLSCWGHNDWGQVGLGLADNIVRLVGRRIEPAGGAFEYTGRVIALGGEHTLVSNGEEFWGWGGNDFGQLAPSAGYVNSLPFPLPKPGDLDIASLGATLSQADAGRKFTCAVLSNKSAHCWGSDDYGQNGRDESLGEVVSLDQPVLENTFFVSSGEQHVCALDIEGRVHCWGRNLEGQLGDGALITKHKPVAVGAFPAKVLQIVAGGFHSCARLEDGSVYCWGKNDRGQLGDGTTTNRSVPTRVVF